MKYFFTNLIIMRTTIKTTIIINIQILIISKYKINRTLTSVTEKN